MQESLFGKYVTFYKEFKRAFLGSMSLFKKNAREPFWEVCHFLKRMQESLFGKYVTFYKEFKRAFLGSMSLFIKNSREPFWEVSHF